MLTAVHRRRLALSLATVALTGLGSAVPRLVGTSDTSTPAESGSGSRAQAVLAQAQALFARTAQTSHRAYTPQAMTATGGREATLVLRDLRLALPDLHGDDIRVAQRLLARPGVSGRAYGS